MGGGCGYKRAAQGILVMKVSSLWWWMHELTHATKLHTVKHVHMCRYKWVKEDWVNLSKIGGLFQYLYSGCNIVLRFWKEDSSFPERWRSSESQLTKDTDQVTQPYATNTTTKISSYSPAANNPKPCPHVLNIEDNVRWSLTPESIIPFSHKDSTLFSIYLFLLLEC